MTRPRDELRADELPEVEVFSVAADGELIPQREVEQVAVTVEEFIDVLRDVAESGVRRARDFHAHPGRRIGAVPADQARARGRSDVIHSVNVRPGAAVMALLDADLTAHVVRLEVDSTSATVATRHLSWRVGVRAGLLRRPRAATLRVRSSPSGNVTVIELVPDPLRRWQVAAFVRTGTRCAADLGRDIARAA